MLEIPALIAHRIFLPGTLEGIHAQVRQIRRAQHVERFLPDAQSFRFLLQEGDLPVGVTQRRNVAVIGPIDEFLARPFTVTFERRREIVAVEVNLVRPVADGAEISLMTVEISI